MINRRGWVVLLLAAVILIAVAVKIGNQPVPNCKIVDGKEIDNHHCIPYCPPDPKECDG